jgi:predicted enzyme related to lactoylglutathione lyase
VERPQVVWAEVTVDCRDAERVAMFWSELLDLRPKPQSDGWFQLGPDVAGGPVINFQPVPEAKSGKTRIHLDVWVDDLEAAIALVERLGGHSLDEVHVHPQGTVVVMADVEGNEFCLVSLATG